MHPRHQRRFFGWNPFPQPLQIAKFDALVNAGGLDIFSSAPLICEGDSNEARLSGARDAALRAGGQGPQLLIEGKMPNSTFWARMESSF